MKREKILRMAAEANRKANEYRREADLTHDAKTMFLAVGYRMEVECLMKKVA